MLSYFKSQTEFLKKLKTNFSLRNHKFEGSVFYADCPPLEKSSVVNLIEEKIEELEEDLKNTYEIKDQEKVRFALKFQKDLQSHAVNVKV